MENASKALLIAGAILLSILIISLGVIIFNTFGNTAREMANMNEQEIASFNSKIMPYKGQNVSGTQVRALVQLARSIDQNAINTNDAFKRLSVYYNSKAVIELKKDDTSISSTVSVSTIATNKYYIVTPTYTDGLITRMDIQDKT